MDIIVDDWSAVRPVRLGLEVAAALRELYPKEWEPKNFDRLLVHKATYEGRARRDGGRRPGAGVGAGPGGVPEAPGGGPALP